ncbi:MAG: DUF4124 domain-containing protein [Lysobacterales bacterium]
MKIFSASATLFILLLLALPGHLWAQAIYKTIDADGNVTYTDQPPSEDAEPLDLAPITVADPYESRVSSSASSGNENIDDLIPYADLTLISPTQEQHFWGTGGTFTAQAATTQPLSRGHLLQFVLDGTVAGTGSGLFMEFTGIDRGEHQLRAQVVTTSGEVLARTDNVVFFMRQQSVINRARNN